MIVGTEWLIEAMDCDAAKLRQIKALQQVFARVIRDLNLQTVGDALWHKFPAPGAGVTGLVMLTESHLACHTYPEHQTATFNLYCCRERAEWNWTENLTELLGARRVHIQKIERGPGNAGILPVVATGIPAGHTRDLQIIEAHKPDSRQAVAGSRFKNVKIRERRLPHLERDGSTYFITFRLADSLPQSVLEKIKFEREQSEKISTNSVNLSKHSKQRVSRAFSQEIEKYLDLGIGLCSLKNPQIAQIVADALNFFQGKRYQLFAWCIMPNHVHVVVKPHFNHSLDEILHSWKSFTASKANKILKREGHFWQREYYDHLIRNDREFYRIIRYVKENPLKANLEDWRWVEVAVTNHKVDEDMAAPAGSQRDNRQDAGGTVGGESR